MWSRLIAILLAAVVGFGSLGPALVSGASSFFNRGQETETEPAETEPAETEPAETEPAKTEPGKTDPAGKDPTEVKTTESEEVKEQDIYSGVFRFKAPEDWILEDYDDGSLYLWLDEEKGVYIYLDTYYLNDEYETSKEYFDELEESIYGEDNYGISKMTGKTRDYVLNGVDVRRMFSTFYSISADITYYTEDILMIGADQLTYLVFECMPEDYFDFHQSYEAFLTSLEVVEAVG